MSARRRLAQVRDLALLQRAECDAASGEIAEARAGEIRAIADAEAEAGRVEALAVQWHEATAKGSLDPAASYLIGGMLIDAEAVANLQAETAMKATRRHDAAIARWHGLYAHFSAVDRLSRNLARNLARADDEASLQASADRTTAMWRRS